MTPTFDNWTRVEAMQQGLTAEVNCTVTPASDPNISIHWQTFAAAGITAFSLCCNCTSAIADSEGWPFLVWISAFY